jgi:glutamyl-tRNA(Gln) amidotransferase subunit D
MHENSDDNSIAIISGLHARKNHSSKRNAFVSINVPLVARVREGVEIVDQERVQYLKEQSGKTTVLPFADIKVGYWKAHPQSFHEELALFQNFDGLLIEGTGLGHAPINKIDDYTDEHVKIRKTIFEISKKIPVVMTTQTISGRINMNVYTPGRELIQASILGQGTDMTPETAFIKLAWLISNHGDTSRELIAKNLRGEISERSSVDSSRNE